MYDTKIMILAGAGASIPVGIPGMEGMADAFHEALPRDSDAQRGFVQLQEFGAGSDLEELLELANDIVGFSESELDEFVDSCVGVGKARANRLRDYHRKRNQVITRVEAFRVELLEWLKKACLDYDKSTAAEVYGKFVEAVAASGIPVFTTNYDAVLEQVASRKGVPVVDNFVPEGDRQFWDDSLESYQDVGLRIVKLHGSVYWHASKTGRIEKLDPPSSVNSDGKPVKRLVIVPTRFKDIYQRNYFPLYTSFLRTLGQADLCVIIGHSLRDEYLSAAIRDRLRDKSFHIIVIDPNIDLPSDLYSGAVEPDSQIIHVKKGAEYLREIYGQIMSVRSTDEAIQLVRELSTAVEQGRDASLAIVETPHWLAGGTKNSIRVRISTVLRAGVLKGRIEVGKETDRQVNLGKQIERAWKSAPTVGPLEELERSITVYMRKAIGQGPHRLVFNLAAADGSILARASKSIRLKGL